MNEKEKKMTDNRINIINKNRIIRLIIVCILLWVFQFGYLKLMERILLDVVAKNVTGLTNSEYLMIHHLLMFIPLFLITYCIHCKNKVDFGYRIRNYKDGIKYLIFSSAFGLLVSLITTFMGNVYEVRFDDILFQLFFSGLGEEILFRSLPITILIIVLGNDPEIRIFKRIPISLVVILSSILFALGHVSITSEGISYSTLQLFCCFGGGMIFGECYRKTKNIWICMLMHGIYNVLAILFNSLF